MSKFRKKPVVVEAEVYKEGMEDGSVYYAIGGQTIGYFSKDEKCVPKAGRVPVIKTSEGVLQIAKGDYIVTDTQGKRYPCKPDIFEATYELVEE